MCLRNIKKIGWLDSNVCEALLPHAKYPVNEEEIRQRLLRNFHGDCTIFRAILALDLPWTCRL